MARVLERLAKTLAASWAAARTFGARFAHCARLFVKMVAKPKVVLLWLGRSHLAQALLVAVVLLMPHTVPDLADRLLAKIYQPVERRLLGVIPIERTNPSLKARQAQLRFLLQYGAGLGVFLAFWFAIPAALRRGEELAERREAEADKLLETSPSQAVVLYRQALGYVTDTAHTLRLQEKLAALDRAVATALPAADGGKTVVLSPVAPAASRYEVRRELGRGAMGVVLLAHDTVLERDVAIKELPSRVLADAPLLERFRREAKALARLNHPGIVHVYDFTEDQGAAWIVMEYVVGEELARRVDPDAPMAPGEVVRLARAMAEALGYAHERGVLHRDMKPANVLVTAVGAPKIMDFGVARLVHQGTATLPGSLLGSPAYMSPEQALGKGVDARADVYGLGAILYALLTGAPPYGGSLPEVLGQLLAGPPTPLQDKRPDLDPSIAQVVEMMMARDVEDRYRSMADVVEALGAL